MKRLETMPREARQAPPDPAPASPSSKVRDWHQQRKAVVYIRQSTPHQVLEHRESTDRQYALVDRAALLHPPKRAQRFTLSMIAGFLAKDGWSGPRPRALSKEGMLRSGKWLLSDPARELHMPSATLHR